MERTEVLKALSEFFSLEELRQLSFGMHIDHEQFSPQKPQFIRELIEYCERSNRISELIVECKNQRPNIDWSKINFEQENVFDKDKFETSLFSTEKLREHCEALLTIPQYKRWSDESNLDHYIPGESKFLPMLASPYDDQIGGQKEALIPVIRSHKHLIVLGEPGTGKTVALQKMMWETAMNQKAIIPIYVPLLYFRKSLLESVRVSLNETGVFRFSNHKTVRLFLQEVPCLIMFDGLNEIPGSHREQGKLAIVNFLREFSLHRYVVTSRSQDRLWKELRAANVIQDAVVVQPITNEQAHSYLIAHLGPRRGNDLYDRLNERMKGLSRTPLLLWLIKEAGMRGRELPGNRGELFDSFTNQILERDARLGSTTVEWANYTAAMKQTLAYLAFTLQEAHQLVFNRKRALKIAENFLIQEAYKLVYQGKPIRKLFRRLSKKAKIYREKSRLEAEEILNDALRHGFLVGDNQIRFMHQSMQEYFTATYLNNLNLTELYDSVLNRVINRFLVRRLVKRAKHEWWADSFVQLAGLTNNPSLLIDELLRLQPWLAFWCTIEGQSVNGKVKHRVEKKTIALLNSKESTQRLIALQELNRMNNPRTIEYVVTVLSDPSGSVRDLAAQILAEQGEPAVESLFGALNGTFRARRAAIRSLGQMWQIPDLIELGSEHSDERVLAAKRLSSCNDVRIMDSLFATLKDEDAKVRETTAYTIGKLKFKDSLQLLVRELKNEDWKMREGAAMALGELGDKKAVPYLIDVLNEELYRFVLLAIVDSLGKLKDERAISPLNQALKNNEHAVTIRIHQVLNSLFWNFD